MADMGDETPLFNLTPMSSTTTKPLRFLRRGEVIALSNVPPTRTLLELLREDLACTGTKEGCGEGDCGACTVVLAEPAGQGLAYRAINSCIALAHSIDGLALWTVEDLTRDPLLQSAGQAPGALHPVQQALVDSHATQCGFCTPGFVMSLFAMYQNHAVAGQPITRELAQRELSGNLCRCTGYRPILEAAQQMAQLPPVTVDEPAVQAGLARLRAEDAGVGEGGAYLQPGTLAELLALRAAHPQAQLVAGCTDVGLWITKQHRDFAQVLDLTRVAELRRIELRGSVLRIGAAARLAQAFAALVQARPELDAFAARFAGLPVRNAGTLGGNVANGSPIGDAMPLLIALGARIVLASRRGEREMPLEDFYTGYRRNLLAPDEVLAFIDVPRPEPAGQGWLRAYKISKRYDDDISAVCLAIELSVLEGRVARVSIGCGGVAATPVRARQTEAALLGQPWTEDGLARAIEAIRQEFQPISDMRASAAYRSQVAGNLLQRFWLESQGATEINLETVGGLA